MKVKKLSRKNAQEAAWLRHEQTGPTVLERFNQAAQGGENERTGLRVIPGLWDFPIHFDLGKCQKTEDSVEEIPWSPMREGRTLGGVCFSTMSSPEPALHTFFIPGLHLKGGQPAAYLVNEAGEELPPVIPAGLGAERRWTSASEHGLVAWRELSWRHPSGHTLAWTVGQLQAHHGFIAFTSYHNGGASPVRLRELTVFAGADDGLVVEGDPASWTLGSTGGTRREATLDRVLPALIEEERLKLAAWNMAMPDVRNPSPYTTDGRWRTFRDFATLYARGGERGVVFAPAGPAEADLRLSFRVEGARLRPEIESEMNDVLVEPGETRRSQALVVLAGPYVKTLEAAFRGIAQTHGARVDRRPAWGGCSWYHYFRAVSANSVTSLARTVAANREAIDMPVIQIDDGFEITGGDWRPNGQFPDGLAPVAKEINAAGATAGVWFAPMCVLPGTAVHDQNPGWLQRDVAGKIVESGTAWGDGGRWLDPSLPETRAWMADILREHWLKGYNYFKIDFNVFNAVSRQLPEGARPADPRLTRLQAMRELYRAYREAIGPDAYLLGCIGFNRLAVGFADACRIGPDSVPPWDSAQPCCLHDCVQATARSAVANRILFTCDPDVTYTRVRTGMSEHERRTWHGYVGLGGGITMISEPLHLADTVLGRARVERNGDRIRFHARLKEKSPLRDAVPWKGTCVQLFHEQGAARRQVFFVPATGDRPAAALVKQLGGAFVELTGVTLRSESRGDEIMLEGDIAFADFGADPKRPFRAELTLKCDATGAGREEAGVFGSQAAHVSTADYGTLRDGDSHEADVVVRGWSDTAREYAILVPPVPERGLPWPGGDDPEHRTFGFVARRPWGDFATVQTYNPEKTRGVVTPDLSPAASLGRVHVWSFWDRAYLGERDVSAPLAFELDAHECRLLRLTPVDKTAPVLVGSTLHIGVGAAELLHVETSTDSLRIEFTDAGARDGELLVAWAGPLRLVAAENINARLEKAGDNLWRVAIAARARGALQRLSLVV